MSLRCRVIDGGLCELTQEYKPGIHDGMDVVGAGYTLAWETAHSDGTVVAIRSDCNSFESGGSYGNYVKIKHDNGYYTLYAHGAYNTIQVSVGQRVTAGQKIMYYQKQCKLLQNTKEHLLDQECIRLHKLSG